VGVPLRTGGGTGEDAGDDRDDAADDERVGFVDGERVRLGVVLTVGVGVGVGGGGALDEGVAGADPPVDDPGPEVDAEHPAARTTAAEAAIRRTRGTGPPSHAYRDGDRQPRPLES